MYQKSHNTTTSVRPSCVCAFASLLSVEPDTVLSRGMLRPTVARKIRPTVRQQKKLVAILYHSILAKRQENGEQHSITADLNAEQACGKGVPFHGETSFTFVPCGDSIVKQEHETRVLAPRITHAHTVGVRACTLNTFLW